MDSVTLKNGMVIEYDYYLCYDGIIATAHPTEEVTKEQREEFKSKLSSERDLVKLYWQNKL